MKVIGTLPVAIAILIASEAIKIKSVVMRPLTVGQALDSQSGLGTTDYVVIAEYAQMTKLVDDTGAEHDISYAMMRDTSKQNFDYLTTLKAELDAKEIAESVS